MKNLINFIKQLNCTHYGTIDETKERKNVLDYRLHSGYRLSIKGKCSQCKKTVWS